MTDHTPFRSQNRRKILLWSLFVIPYGVVIFLASDPTRSIIAGTAGVIGLFSALLLKLGKIKTGTIWVGDSPLRILLVSIGLLGFGLDYLFSALEETSASGFRLPMAVGVVLLVMIACLPLGLVMEWRASRGRKLRPPADP